MNTIETHVRFRCITPECRFTSISITAMAEHAMATNHDYETWCDSHQKYETLQERFTHCQLCGRINHDL